VPHFSLNVDAAGPVVNAVVSVSEGRRDALEAEKKPVPQSRTIRALVDTGASVTSTDPEVLNALELSPTGTIDIVTPSTGKEVATTETYDIDFAIYKTQNEPPLVIPNLRIASSQLFLQQGIHALIGRDILARCILIYNGEHSVFTLAF
jgi:hypothetical protein